VTDQAASLRLIRGQRTEPTRPPRTRQRAVAITGGKGGVGKSTIAVGLSTAYAAGGARTLLVDCDFGMADLNLLLGVAPTRTLLDALDGTPVDDVLVLAHGIALLPAQNGSYALATMGAGATRRTLDMIENLSSRFDSIVLDVAAGIGASQTSIAGAAADTVVVVNPEPLSMADAYACLKVLAGHRNLRHAYVVPNRVQSTAQADDVVGRLTELVNRFLDVQLTALPAIPADPAVSEAAIAGVPLLIHRPDSPAARAITRLARALDTATSPDTRSDAARGFWRRHFTAGGESL
jgi:flagellar biosynthesis protein FlhG